MRFSRFGNCCIVIVIFSAFFTNKTKIMTKENHSKGTQILEQIDKLESLSKKIGVEYRKSTDNDLKELLNKCDEAVNVLKEINQDKFKAL